MTNFLELFFQSSSDVSTIWFRLSDQLKNSFTWPGISIYEHPAHQSEIGSKDKFYVSIEHDSVVVESEKVGRSHIEPTPRSAGIKKDSYVFHLKDSLNFMTSKSVK